MVPRTHIIISTTHNNVNYSILLFVPCLQLALAVREGIFGSFENNLHLAQAHEDLAYAYYVHDYNYGNFGQAM